MFNQDEFNKLCDRYVIARVAEIRLEWLLSEDHPTSWEVLQKVTEDVLVVNEQLNRVIRQQRDADQGNLMDDMEMLDMVAAALFIVNPNLPDGMRKPGNTWNPMVNWFATYLTSTAKFWQSRGRRAALVSYANEVVKLGRLSS